MKVTIAPPFVDRRFVIDSRAYAGRPGRFVAFKRLMDAVIDAAIASGASTRED